MNIITKREDDFSRWYLDIIKEADLAEHGPVRGTMVIKPYGYALWEKVQSVLDAKFKELGVQNAYFPLFIPEKFLHKEASHVEGFSPEVAVVTHAGGSKLPEPVVVRPTSETIMYDTFKNWIRSHRDLPLLINQWANVVRWEMRPRLFLRTTEFLWQEGHTVHSSPNEADAFSRTMLEVYEWFAKEYMAIPVVPGEKSENERFAGAFRTYCIEAMMQDGRALQFATSHNLGQNFAEAFEIMFLNENNQKEYGHQTSWGLSTRSIGGLIMTHSDDKGLVLPPNIAPIQVVIIPIVQESTKETVYNFVTKYAKKLKEQGVRIHVDQREQRPGEKFFEWEKKGVPVRLEIGARDIESSQVTYARRDIEGKYTLTEDEFLETIEGILSHIQSNLYDKALTYRQAKTVSVDTWEEFTEAIEAENFVLAHWCGESEIEDTIKEKTKATIRCIPFDAPEEEGICIYSNKPSKKRVLFAKSY